MICSTTSVDPDIAKLSIGQEHFEIGLNDFDSSPVNVTETLTANIVDKSIGWQIPVYFESDYFVKVIYEPRGIRFLVEYECLDYRSTDVDAFIPFDGSDTIWDFSGAEGL